MKKVKQFFKDNSMFVILFLTFLIVNLLINMTIYRGERYYVHLPGKDDFGTYSFWVTIIIGLLCSIGIYFGNKKNWKTENIYLLLAIPLGLLFLIFNPLGKVTDEDMHARKAAAISYGNFFSYVNEEGLAVCPINSKFNEVVSRTTKSYDEAFEKMGLTETEEMIDLEYTTMALYAPICHMPQAFGLFITRICGAGVVVQCYAARLVNMLLATFLMYEAIKLMPYKKYLILFLGLLPITLNEFASMASDAFTIGFCIFYIAYILNIKYLKDAITKKDKILLGIYSVIVALLKIVYIPLVFLLLLIPKKKYDSKKQKVIFVTVVIILSVILNLIWLAYCSRFLIEFNPGVDSGAQTIGILKNPFGYMLIMFRTLNTYFQTFVVSLCGEGLGHYNVQTSVLYVFSCIIIAFLLFFGNEEEEKLEFDLKTKIICLLVFLAIAALIYTSIYVQWTEYTKPTIWGIQARYFLPFMPLIAIVLDNKNLIIKKFNKMYLYMFMLFINLNAVSMILYTYLDGGAIDIYVK